MIMSDSCISIVPKLSSYPDNKVKAQEILNWLVSEDIVKPTLSDCVLGSDNGYAISEGARRVSNHPEYLPFNLITNGLEINTERNVFDTGQNGMDGCICPNCKEDILSEDWGFINDWFENKSDSMACPFCNVSNDINKFKFSPEWGFSDLGFTFWNWSDLTDEFIAEFRQKLGCDISIIYTHI